MKNGCSRQLELLSCIRQSLPFMDRRRIYHESSLKKNGTPVEFSYHFELYRVLSTMASSISWFVTSKARNAAEGINNRLDIYVANNGSRYGFKLIADASKAQLTSHYTDQAKIYKDALALSELMVVNFISQIPDGNRPEWWFITEDPDITIIHVHLPSRGSKATIMRSLNPEYDEEISLATSNLRNDTAVDDIAQQMSEARIGESRDVSAVNFSKLPIADPTKIVVSDIVFFLSRHNEIRDLLKAVKEELMENQTDAPLRLYSKTDGTFFSVSNDTIETFSSANESHEDLEVRCGELSWSITVK